MKKFLIITMVSLMVTSTAFAADTYTGALLEVAQKKLETKASPLIQKERELQAKQNAAVDLRNQQEAERQLLLIQRQQQFDEAQRKQRELIDKKKQQLQEQKSFWQGQKQFWKDMFTF